MLENAVSLFQIRSILLFSLSEFLGAYLIIVLLLYFIPTVIGANTRSSIGIFLLNLLLGWTVVGWLGALIWALSSNSNKKAERQHKNLINTLQNNQSHNQDLVQLPINNSFDDLQNFSKDKSNLLSQLSQLHGLREKNVITEEIYEQEKYEILSKLTKQKDIEKDIQNKMNDESPPLFQTQYDPAYEELFGKKNWFQRNKNWTIAMVIVSFSGIAIWYFAGNSPKTNNNFDNSNIQSVSINTSYYIVNANEYNLVHFFKSAEITTQKASYFKSNDTVYVQRIENDFGYVEFTNRRGQTSKGWLKMTDLQSCFDCGNNN